MRTLQQQHRGEALAGRKWASSCGGCRVSWRKSKDPPLSGGKTTSDELSACSCINCFSNNEKYTHFSNMLLFKKVSNTNALFSYSGNWYQNKLSCIIKFNINIPKPMKILFGYLKLETLKLVLLSMVILSLKPILGLFFNIKLLLYKTEIAISLKICSFVNDDNANS